jgi:tetratricopeptide (TPR) repeat protein
VARTAIYDKTSLLYAHVTNTEGAAYYDMNYLGRCKAAFELSLDIRQKLLQPDDAEIANVLGNLGNAESAEGNYQTALEYLEKSAEIRAKLGSEEAVYLALNWLMIGRVYSLQERDSEAYQMFQKAESMLNRKGSRNRLFLGHVHFEFGNLEMKQGELDAALLSFEKARTIARSQGALIPLTASAYYKLGVVEFNLGHPERALNFLGKALDIAETRDPDELEGGVTRVRWKIADVRLDEAFDEDGREEALAMKFQAEQRRKEIADRQGIVLPETGDIEKTFDLLVPGYFR